jgi:hypothetical protein
LLIATTVGLASLILKIALVPIWQSAGVAIGGAVAYGLFFTIPAILFVYKKIKRPAVNFETLRV